MQVLTRWFSKTALVTFVLEFIAGLLLRVVSEPGAFWKLGAWGRLQPTPGAG